VLTAFRHLARRLQLQQPEVRPPASVILCGQFAYCSGTLYSTRIVNRASAALLRNPSARRQDVLTCHVTSAGLQGRQRHARRPPAL
jgi:hypothetical protein